MIQVQNQNYGIHKSQNQKKNETLLFILFEIYFLAIKWQSHLLNSILNSLACFSNGKSCVSVKTFFTGVGSIKVYFSSFYTLDPKIKLISGKKFRLLFDSSSSIVSDAIHININCADELKQLLVVETPISFTASTTEDLYCFYCEDKNFLWRNWQTNLTYNSYNATFTISKSGFYMLVSRKRQYLERKHITISNGGLIVHRSEKGDVQMSFPPNSLDGASLIATIQVIHQNDNFYHDPTSTNILAGPVVCLGPSGSMFKEDVEVTIPIFGSERLWTCQYKFDLPWKALQFYVSQTKMGEKPIWKVLNTEYKINWEHYSVTFKVQHFSLYKAVVNVLDTILPETVKLHASTCVPGLTFLTNIQAHMTNCNHNKQFGICITGCRSSTGHSYSGLNEYPSQVGWCTPRQLKSGKLIIKLKSKLFTADESIGECSTGMTKYINYTGLDFDIQFSCVLNVDNIIPDVEMFGKVIIAHIDDLGNNVGEFSFNLIKKQQETFSSQISSSPQTTQAKNTTAASFDFETWKDLAVVLGYSSDVIQYFAVKEEPFFEVYRHYLTAGGNEEHFFDAMSMFTTCSNESSIQHVKLRDYVRAKKRQQCELDEIRTKLGKRTFHEAFRDECSHPGASQHPDESQLDDIASRISQHWKRVGRKLNISENKLNEINMNYSDSTECEKAYQMLIAWREIYPEKFTVGSPLHSSRSFVENSYRNIPYFCKYIM